ncbi:MAG: ATP phosphoribosyltransferase [Thiohalomonadales bacterium]
MKAQIIIALSKGRIYDETLPLLAHAGIVAVDDPNKSRKLILDTNHEHIKLLVLRAADVPTYVQYGAADLGVAGKDVLLEHGGSGLYEPLDLRIACCKLMVAGKKELAEEKNTQGDHKSARLRIATKYIHSTRHYFASKRQQVEIIKLYGSMELAPIVGLADRIVDVVDTGNTLKANGLIPLEHIIDISSRLIVNKVSMKLKHEPINELINQLESAVLKKT